MGHAGAKLGSGRLRSGREECDEIFILGFGLRQAGPAAFVIVGIRDSELRFRQVFVVGIRVDESLKGETTHVIAAVADFIDGLFVKDLVRLVARIDRSSQVGLPLAMAQKTARKKNHQQEETRQGLCGDLQACCVFILAQSCSLQVALVRPWKSVWRRQPGASIPSTALSGYRYERWQNRPPGCLPPRGRVLQNFGSQLRLPPQERSPGLGPHEAGKPGGLSARPRG